jgi:hypothetical protein
MKGSGAGYVQIITDPDPRDTKTYGHCLKSDRDPDLFCYKHLHGNFLKWFILDPDPKMKEAS